MAAPLLELFELDELDLAANRAGRLSPTQHERVAQRVNKITIVSVGALVLFILAALARGADGEWLLLAPVSVLVISAIVVGLRIRSTQFGPVRVLSGPVQVTSVSEDVEGSRSTRLVVGGQRCKVMGASQRRDELRAAFGGGDYDLYVVGKQPIVVGAEPSRADAHA